MYAMTIVGVAALLAGTLAAHAQTWNKGPAFPGAGRDAAISFAVGENVYIGGGGGKDFYAYNTTTRSWTRKADIPGVTTQRAFGAGFSIGTKGYVGFGFDAGSILKKDLWEYDPATDKWTRKADLPGIPRDGVTCFVVGGKAYIGGGSDNQYVYADFYSYDPTADAWTQLADLPTGPAIFQSSFTIGAHGYITGGSGGVGEIGDLYRYDPARDEWDLMAEFPGTARQCAVAFALDGRGYVGLGQSGYTTPYADFYSYDPSADAWAPAEGLPADQARAWSTACVANGRAYVGTGWNFSGPFMNDWWELSGPAAGVDAAAERLGSVTLLPNPAHAELRVSLSGSERLTRVTAYDALGERVPIGTPGYAADDASLNVAGLAPGRYMLRIETTTGMFTRWFIKQ